ncbi:uncharacterized protein PITG_07357 [Phytophthora infestans T30-4]|uniref:Uncharacterized protein n=1 Tax=Phytophthora infestans (strain T30-4) TaxID=403677 RepID=D0N879_PHYIT|nr:uncharacterized protein PITG_07357 [Phytophthora infestans T30-4]EEY53764.1 conserved hypothetical protein [Phytophthora infestans T30-4]|eukprot:XP_002904395.1 conserved hypothetical protein [Phytophthora infestans T30-4]
MQKNKKGFMYINYNCSATSITTGGSAGTVAATNIASINSNMNFGNTCPILWNADVNGTATSGSGIAPSQTFSRQLAPTYSPNQSADNVLIQKKTFRYIERVTNKFTVQAGQSFRWTLTNGIANPKKLIMQPVITN